MHRKPLDLEAHVNFKPQGLQAPPPPFSSPTQEDVVC